MLLQYFGFYDKQVEVIAKSFNENSVFVIEDITHSMFQSKSYSNYADYVFGSFRKWTCFYSGAFAKRIKNNFILQEPIKTNLLYTELRKNAATMKLRYINDKLDNKDEFLNCFNKAENLLETDYANYYIDDISAKRLLSLDVNYIKERRVKNANIIVKGIVNKDIIKPIFNDIKENDCPLFVPIMVDNAIRDRFKNYLIKNNIFCPIHWSISDLHGISDEAKVLYNKELSLVCDQRYDELEIKYFVDIINDFRM